MLNWLGKCEAGIIIRAGVEIGNAKLGLSSELELSRQCQAETINRAGAENTDYSASRY